LTQIHANGHGAECGGGGQLLLQTLAVAGADIDVLGQTVERGIHVLDLFGNDDQSIGGQVLCQHLAVAIVYQTPHRLYDFDPHAVVLGTRLEIVVAGDLQPTDARDENTEHDHHDQGGHVCSRPENVPLRL